MRLIHKIQMAKEYLYTSKAGESIIVLEVGDIYTIRKLPKSAQVQTNINDEHFIKVSLAHGLLDIGYAKEIKENEN